MNMDMTAKDILKAGLLSLGVSVADEVCDQFFLYKDLLLEWNQKINLTAITDEKEIITKHFIDSISILSHAGISPAAKIIDVGTGAGFPGIPIKLICPDTEILLLDSLNKRINFLNEVITQLGLQKISALHSRAEDAAKDARHRAQYDVCCSRAVARLSTLTEYCLPFVKTGGLFVAMKGPDVSQEIQDAKIAIQTLGGEIIGVKTVLLYNTDINHTLIVIKKIRQTPAKYPRLPVQITKFPIK